MLLLISSNYYGFWNIKKLKTFLIFIFYDSRFKNRANSDCNFFHKKWYKAACLIRFCYTKLFIQIQIELENTTNQSTIWIKGPQLKDREYLKNEECEHWIGWYLPILTNEISLFWNQGFWLGASIPRCLNHSNSHDLSGPLIHMLKIWPQITSSPDKSLFVSKILKTNANCFSRQDFSEQHGIFYWKVDLLTFICQRSIWPYQVL